MCGWLLPGDSSTGATGNDGRAENLRCAAASVCDALHLWDVAHDLPQALPRPLNCVHANDCCSDTSHRGRRRPPGHSSREGEASRAAGRSARVLRVVQGAQRQADRLVRRQEQRHRPRRRLLGGAHSAHEEARLRAQELHDLLAARGQEEEPRLLRPHSVEPARGHAQARAVRRPQARGQGALGVEQLPHRSASSRSRARRRRRRRRPHHPRSTRARRPRSPSTRRRSSSSAPRRARTTSRCRPPTTRRTTRRPRSSCGCTAAAARRRATRTRSPRAPTAATSRSRSVAVTAAAGTSTATRRRCSRRSPTSRRTSTSTRAA